MKTKDLKKLMALAAIAAVLTGCATRNEGNICYIKALHRSWTDIDRAVREDGSLRQVDMNIGSGLAVTLAREEAAYWSGLCAERGLTVPAWEKRLAEIAEAPAEFEGGSAAPLSKHLEMLAALEEAIGEMRTACGDGKR